LFFHFGRSFSPTIFYQNMPNNYRKLTPIFQKQKLRFYFENVVNMLVLGKAVYLAVLNLAVDFRSRRSLSAGVPGSLLGALAPVGSPPARTPAGVERLPLQSTG
jgi:hypothetical protein